MSENNKQNNRLANNALALLARLAITQYQQKFDIKAGPEQILALLRWAAASDKADVNALLVNCGEAMSSAHRRFFESNDIRFEPLADRSVAATEMTYRGKKILKQTHSQESVAESKNDGEDGRKGKRKITYRGQEKWV